MAWMSDEQYELMQDTREKAITARSARSTRTHCGKRGPVRFPSDSLTKKEREAMNGKCESYRLNDPMTWEQFKSMPNDLQIIYIKALRNKYRVPDTALAKAMGVKSGTFGAHIRKLKLGLGRAVSANGRMWFGTPDEDIFVEWWNRARVKTESVEETVEGSATDEIVVVNDEPEIVTPADSLDEGVRKASEILGKEFAAAMAQNEDDTEGRNLPTICDNPYHFMPIIPKSGTMTFEGNNADDALATIRALLSNVNVNITVSWEALPNDQVCTVM